MSTRLLPRLVGATLLLPALLLASACGGRGLGVQSFPPSADLQAATEPKQKPTVEIVTDPQANERYNAAIESRGDRIYDAAVRICEWAVEMGMKPGFECRRDPPH